MITVTDQTQMIEIGQVFLHQETPLTIEIVETMDAFEIYYETRDMVKKWNMLPPELLANKKLALEIQGFNL